MKQKQTDKQTKTDRQTNKNEETKSVLSIGQSNRVVAEYEAVVSGQFTTVPHLLRGSTV